MKLNSLPRFSIGIAIILILTVSYFIELNIDSGSNYETIDTLLGVLVLHSPIIFGLYMLFSAIMIVWGIKKIRIV